MRIYRKVSDQPAFTRAALLEACLRLILMDRIDIYALRLGL